MTRTDMHQSMKRRVTPLGVALFGIHFNSDAFQQLQKEGPLPKDATVLFNPDDIRMIGVKFVGRPILALTSKVLDTCDEPVSLEEWVAAYKAVKAFRDAGGPQ